MNEVLLLFATLSMHDAVARAVAHSPELRVLEAQVEQARQSAIINDQFRPSASLSTSPGYATGLPTSVLGEVPAIATAEVHKVFYDTTARAQQIGAEAEVDAAQSRVDAQRREVQQNTAELYARVAADQALVSSARQRVEAHQTMATRVEALAKEGRARDVDVNRAALQIASANRVLLQAQSRLDLDQLRLDRMVGEHVDVSQNENAAVASQGSLEKAEANDPQLRALEKRIATLQDMLGSERRFLKPTIAGQIQYSRLYDRYGRFYNNFKPDDFSAAATVTLPVWTSGRRTAAIARVQTQLQELIATRDARRTELELSLRSSEMDYDQALAERDLAIRARNVAQEGLRVAQQLATEGRGEVNDVPMAQIALAESEDDLANAAAHVAIARTRLMIVRGDPI
ncbi:MAG TPA: TolC family protein [Thermoanaerobaculia bacterium]|nr:TolC family protein [Thermoanaerobaculia bacterium]